MLARTKSQEYRDFLNKINEGCSPELKPIVQEIVNAHISIQSANNPGIYTAAYIIDMTQKKAEELQEKYRAFYAGLAEKTNDQIKRIVEKYKEEMNKMTSEEAGIRIFQLNSYGNKLKAYNNTQLVELAKEIMKDITQLELDKIYILCSELRNRGETNLADRADKLLQEIGDVNAEEPWLNDPEYKRLLILYEDYKNSIYDTYIRLSKDDREGFSYSFEDLIGIDQDKLKGR